MSILDALAIIAAGVGAGTINAIVGSGSLITFPTLLLLGFPPVTANISNNVGMVAGGLSATFGYRRELAGHGRGLARLVPVSLVGTGQGREAADEAHGGHSQKIRSPIMQSDSSAIQAQNGGRRGRAAAEVSPRIDWRTHAVRPRTARPRSQCGRSPEIVTRCMMRRSL